MNSRINKLSIMFVVTILIISLIILIFSEALSLLLINPLNNKVETIEFNYINMQSNLLDNTDQTKPILNKDSGIIINSIDIIEEKIESIEPVYIEPIKVAYSVPNVNSSMKTYMDYKCITDTSSMQYQLQQQAYTDSNGLRKVGDYYCIALGTYYTNTIGDIFEITLSSGNTFVAIIADIKSDNHTNSTHQYTVSSGDIIEFVVDTQLMSSCVKSSGSISTINEFKGEVTEIKKMEKDE